MRKQLNGYVVYDQELWLYQYFEIPAFCPQDVRNFLAETPEGEDIVLEINSFGGSVYAGFEMYSILRSAERRTVAEVQSIAASAASVVMLGCQEVTASPVAQVMIHLPLTATDGNRYDHQESIGVLDSITESILNAYTMKCGALATRGELKSLMSTSTWLTAPEAKDLGLVDRIIGEESIDPSAILNCAGGVCHGIRSMSAGPMPDAAALKERYARLVAAGKAEPRNGIGEPRYVTAHFPEEQNCPDLLEEARARLELEKIRF